MGHSHPDDLGRPGKPDRVVSLVPSITEALAADLPEALVGATDWCTRPAGLEVERVRGTKNPDLARIAMLEPDLVIANKEENRELDVRRLRERGIRVWVTEIETVPQALDSLEQLYVEALRRPIPDWLVEARRLWDAPLPPVTRRIAVPIWRDPWMVVGPRTFAGDLLRRLGWENVYAGGEERYPHVELAALRECGADVVVLPDEPYVFSAEDGPEAFPDVATELIEGRLITWYGPSLVEAHQRLAR